MKKTWKKLLGILLAVVLVLPSLTSIASAIEPAPKLTAEEAVNAAWALWDEINALEESLEAQKLPEKDLVSRLYDFVASQDEVEKIVREEDDQFGFYTTGNVYNIYDRKEEGFKGGNVDGMIEALGDQIETMDITPVGSLKIGVYSPYYGYDGNMTRNYYEAAVGIQEALGDESVVFDYYGNGSQYGEFATVESFKNWSDYGVVLVDSHGTMSGGTSWICSPLMSDYDPIDVTEGRLAISGGGVWITGTFFEKYCELPNTFIYLGICEGMKSRGLCDPLVAAGAGFVAGYSESVTFYYDGLMMPTICEYLVTESPSDPSRFYTAEEACLKAKEIHGPVDTYGDAVLLWAGNNDLVVQQTPVAATGVALDPASVDLYNNNTYKFNVVTTPADANNYTLSWASSNESVATVAEDGTVTVVGEGTATITVTLNDQLESGVFTATATVNGLGNMAVSGISLDPTAIDTYVGAAPVEITAVIAPANASNQNITWTSSDENVATVDNGVVTGVGAGTATITATTEDGGFTATATVNVVTLDDALNAEGNNLSFQNDPTNPWIMDDSDGRVSAVSNIQGQSNGASTISTTVEMTAGQPMTFDWKVNSENNYDWLTFKVNGAQVDRISGTRNWATKTWTAPSDGSYTFSWTYSKDSSVNTGSDCGWVDNVDVSNEPIIPTPTPDLPGEGFVETNEIIPGEQYIIAVDYNGQTMMMSNELDTDTNIRLVGDPAQMSGNAIVGGYSDNHLWTFSSVTGSTIQSVGNGRYCEVVTHNGYAWLGLADSASYNWTWDGNGNMVTDAPNAGQWNHLSYAETATDIDHPAFDLWVYGQPDYLEIKLYKASGDVPPVTPTPTPVTPPPAGENAFEDSFENGLANWTLVDADGDGNNWMGTYNSSWSGVLPAQDGSEAAFSQSYINYVGALTPDNWMISTEFTVPAENAVLSWYHCASDVDWNEENYSVYVGHGNDPSGYTEVVYNGYPTNTVEGQYQNVTVDLSAYAGQDVQIAFRHHNVSDMYILILDNVVVSGEGDVPPVTPTPTPVTPPPAGENAFEDSFENGLANWTLVDADGDGNNWMGTYNSSWSGVLPAQDGSEAAFSQSYINYVGALTPDNWMISTEFTVPAENAVLSWYHCASDVDWNEENYSVYVGHGNDPSGYTEVVYNGYPTNTVEGQYQNVTVDLSAYAGQDVQIAFRHHNVSDMYILILDNVVVSGEGDVPPVTPTPTPVIPGDGFVETNEIIPGEEYIIAVDYNGQIMMMSNVLDSDNSIRLVGDPAQMSGDAIVGGYSNNHLWTFSSETASTIQSVGNGRYCEVVTHNGYAWLGLADSASYNWTWDGNGNMVTDAPNAGQWNHLSYAETATDIDHPAFDLWVYGQPDYLEIKLYKASGDVPPVTPTPTPDVPGDLDEALNVEGGTLTFANDATYPWEVRDNYAASGNAGVVSSSSTVTTTVELAEGEALYFDWSVSSESGWDKLIFSVDGTAVRNISGEVDWTQFYYVAPAAGTYTFTWSYTKDGSVDRNNDEGYLDNVYVGEAPEVPEADMYAFNSFEESWITFNSADPSMAAPVGAPGATVFAAEYVDGTVYGYTNDGRFFTTTLSNMSNLNVVGTIGEVIVDMAYNYATGTMYAIGTSDNQAGPRSLHTVDLETGALTLVGSLEDTAVAAIMTLGITTEGEAYGISFAPGNQTNDSYLHTINLETAECEAIGPTGFPINYVQTMAYDHNNDQMLWAQFYSDGMFTQTSALVAVNLETGAGTQLGSTPVGGEVGELLGMFSVPGEGPTPPPADYTIEVGTVEANQGDRVFVPVSMDNLSSGSFTIEYDADALTYITHTNPVDDTFIVVNDWTPGILQIAVVNPIANYEGECMTLEFAVAADAEGTYALDLTVNDGASIVDEITVAVAGEDIEAIDGAIEVVLGYTVTFNYMVDGEWVSESQTVAVGEAAIAPEALPQAHEITQLILLGWDVDFSAVYSDLEVTAEYGLLGDVYTDEELNVSDALLIMRSVAGMESLSEIQELLGDVDQDGDVTIVDALYLVRLIVGAESFNG